MQIFIHRNLYTFAGELFLFEQILVIKYFALVNRLTIYYTELHSFESHNLEYIGLSRLWGNWGT